MQNASIKTWLYVISVISVGLVITTIYLSVKLDRIKGNAKYDAVDIQSINQEIKSLKRSQQIIDSALAKIAGNQEIIVHLSERNINTYHDFVLLQNRMFDNAKIAADNASNCRGATP